MQPAGMSCSLLLLCCVVWIAGRHRIGNGEDTLRRVGPHRTMAAVVGAEVAGAEKPHHGRKSAIKDFYDQNHLSVSSH